MWGWNDDGQLGDGTTTSQTTPYFSGSGVKYTLNQTQTMTYQASITDYSPIRVRYTFSGWYSDPDFITSFDMELTPAEDINLYGYWILNN